MSTCGCEALGKCIPGDSERGVMDHTWDSDRSILS